MTANASMRGWRGSGKETDESGASSHWSKRIMISGYLYIFLEITGSSLNRIDQNEMRILNKFYIFCKTASAGKKVEELASACWYKAGFQLKVI